MVKCPNCGAYIETNVVYGCDRKITKNRFFGRRMSIFENRIDERYPEASEEFAKILEDYKAKIIKTAIVNDKLGWNSLGELERSFLDYNVCLGTLEKIEFNPNKGGHTWIKTETKNPCKYRTHVNGKWNCSCNSWIGLGEKKHSDD